MTTPQTAVYSPVDTLMLYLTEDCNLRCQYCFVDKKPRRMSVETAHKTVDFFLSRPVSGVKAEMGISFFGGEPFLETDLMEEVIAYTRQASVRTQPRKRVRFYATTNGTIATPAVERIVRETDMGLLVSLDGGPDANRYRPFVSGRDSYAAVARNLPRLMAWSSSVSVRMTYHPGALDLLGNVRQVLDLGATSIALCPVVEANWTGHEAALEAAYDELADAFITEARQGRFMPLDITRQVILQWHLHLTAGHPRPVKPCGVGTWLIAVDPDGHVMPCHRFLYRPKDWLGTVDSPYMSGDRWQYVHTQSKDILGCDTCPAQPVCGGGCRVMALLAGNGLHGTHPGHCITTRAHARAARRIYDTLQAEDNAFFKTWFFGGGVPHPGLTETAIR